MPPEHIVVLNTPLPLASSAAALRFALGIAQVDGCTRVLSDNTQLSEMLRSAFLEVSSEQARVLSSSKYLCLIYFKFARFLAAGNSSQIAQIFYQIFFNVLLYNWPIA